MSIPNDSAKSKPKKVVSISHPRDRARPEDARLPALTGLDIPDPPVDDHGRSHKYKPYEVAQWVLELPTVKFKRSRADGSLYTWTAKTGNYLEGGRELVEQLAIHYWEKIGRPERITDRSPGSIVKLVTMQVGYLHDRPEYPLLNVKNGIVNLANLHTGAQHFFPHTPDLITTIQLPVEYNSDIRECPLIDEFIRGVTYPSTEYAELLYDIMTLCIMPNVHNHKLVFLLGQGGNGKSTFLNLLRAILGEDNVSDVSPHMLAERFGREPIVGKLANICGDMDQQALKYTGILKAITGGDSVPIEGKGKAIFSYRPFCRLISSGKDIPLSDDYTDGMYRRYVTVKLPNKFSEDGGKTLTRITTPLELTGLLTKLVHRYHRVHLEGGMRVPYDHEAVLTKHRRQVDSIGEFIGEMIEISNYSDSYVTCPEVYEMYTDWCQGRDIAEKSAKEFWKIFRDRLYSRLPGVRVIKRYLGAGASRVWVYAGLQWRKSESTPIR